MVARLLAVIFGFATVCTIEGCDGSTASHVSTDALASNVELPQFELRLELPATIKNHTFNDAKIQIKNVGKSDVTLVMPGDGSDCRWRTPIVGWSFLPAGSKIQHPKDPPCRVVARCGNVNRLTPDDVFSLKPGETKEINKWTGFPFHQAPGKYRVVFYYSNIPQLEWSGVGGHDEGAMQSVTRSTKAIMISNEVLVEFVE